MVVIITAGTTTTTAATTTTTITITTTTTTSTTTTATNTTTTTTVAAGRAVRIATRKEGFDVVLPAGVADVVRVRERGGLRPAPRPSTDCRRRRGSAVGATGGCRGCAGCDSGRGRRGDGGGGGGVRFILPAKQQRPTQLLQLQVPLPLARPNGVRTPFLLVVC